MAEAFAGPLSCWFAGDDAQEAARLRAGVEQWRALGADYLMLYPMFQVDGVDGQIELLRRVKAAVQT